MAIEVGDKLKPIPDDAWVSLGSAPLDLAVSGKVGRGAAKGLYIYYVGDSSTGKTYFAMSLLAEAAKSKAFDKHTFIYDATTEGGNLFNVTKYFGQDVAERIRPAAGTVARPKPSRTALEFYCNLANATDKGPSIFIEDSMDGLLDEQDEENFEKDRKVIEDAKGELAGSFGMGKAKTNSKNIGRAVADVRDSDSILVIISQTRDKIGGYGGRTRSGGRALRFYSHVELWTSCKMDLKKTVLGKEREYGKVITIDVQKNRINGWEGKVNVPFLWDHGIDDTGACISYLAEEKYWSKDSKTGIITATDFDIKGRLDDIAHKIENSRGGIAKLVKLTESHWQTIAEATKVQRKPRYGN